MPISDLKRGDDYILLIKVPKADNGSDIEIAGDTLIWTVKSHPTDPDPGLHQDIDIIASSTSSALGEHRMQMPAFTIGLKYYDVQWVRNVSGFGAIQTIDEGSFSVLQDVTGATS